MAVRAVLSLYYGIAANGTERRNAAGRVCRRRPRLPPPAVACGADAFACSGGHARANARLQLRQRGRVGAGIALSSG